MPRSSASRGPEKLTGLPSNLNSPRVGLCTPDSVLMRVDFPAPLSPSRQWTCPVLTVRETPFSATTGPKCFTRSVTSISGRPASATMGAALVIGSLPAHDPAADHVVEQNHRWRNRPIELLSLDPRPHIFPAAQ